MGDLLAIIGIAVVAAAGGIVLGMLVAPRIGRLAEHDRRDESSEESGDQPTP